MVGMGNGAGGPDAIWSAVCQPAPQNRRKPKHKTRLCPKKILAGVKRSGSSRNFLLSDIIQNLYRGETLWTTTLSTSGT